MKIKNLVAVVGLMFGFAFLLNSCDTNNLDSVDNTIFNNSETISKSGSGSGFKDENLVVACGYGRYSTDINPVGIYGNSTTNASPGYSDAYIIYFDNLSTVPCQNCVSTENITVKATYKINGSSISTTQTVGTYTMTDNSDGTYTFIGQGFNDTVNANGTTGWVIVSQHWKAPSNLSSTITWELFYGSTNGTEACKTYIQQVDYNCAVATSISAPSTVHKGTVMNYTVNEYGKNCGTAGTPIMLYYGSNTETVGYLNGSGSYSLKLANDCRYYNKTLVLEVNNHRQYIDVLYPLGYCAGGGDEPI